MATAGDRYEALTGNIWAYAHRGDLTGVKAALLRGVNVNLPNTVGWTALHASAAGGHTKVMRFLLKEGADYEITDTGGNLPAHQAAKNGHVHALQVLEGAGADLTAVRLSQGKGAGVRAVLVEALRKAGKDLEEEQVKGYARRQSKSTAFWGPRKTPISGKIKKNILKQRRQKKQQKLVHKLDDKARNANAKRMDPCEQTSESTNEQAPVSTSYSSTVQQVKRSKRQIQKAREGRALRMIADSEATSDDSSSFDKIDSSDSETDEVKTCHHVNNKFELLILGVDDSDEE